jgi:hypothetical protein
MSLRLLLVVSLQSMMTLFGISGRLGLGFSSAW